IDPGRPFEEGMVDVCLMLSGQMYGYLQPCGCSRPQLGGLERREELMHRLARHGYPISAGDLGDLAAREQASPQNRWKFECALKSLKAMHYAGIGLGLTELAMRHDTAFDLAQNYQPPYILAANLLDPETQFPDMFRPWTIDDPRRPDDWYGTIARVLTLQAMPGMGNLAPLSTVAVTGRPRVGYFGLVGESVVAESSKTNTEAKFSKPADALLEFLPAFASTGAEVKVLLFQGTAEEATALLKPHPRIFDVVLCRNDASDGVAPILPIRDESGAILVMVGHKG
ncbi:MAG TPA: hypothetical protein PKA06_03695, partial [Gemmatales bacterium]|nr:hypothetical protein [Gemmatales bacterium]